MAEEKNYQYVLPVGFVLKGGASDYVIEKVLGKGGFGITYKVKGRILCQNIYLDVHFAVKEFFPDNCWRGNDNATLLAPPTKQEEVHDGLQDFINEGRRLQQVCKLNHNIVNVNEVFEANGTAYYVLEYLDGGDLESMVLNSPNGYLTEQQMIEVMMPIGRAVQCLHDHSMLHLDIKPNNVVMRRDDGNGNEEPVLIDFGIAVHFGGDGTPTSKTPSLGVSPGFSPIEQYTQVKSFDPRLDVYAFSATCLYLLTGKAPIEALNMPAGYVKSVMPQHVSSTVADAIERGMSKEKDLRIASIAELLNSFVASAVPPTLPSMPAAQNMAPTRALPPATPVPVAPVPATPAAMPAVQQEEYSAGSGYGYNEPGQEGGSKKKLVLAIVGGVLGLALLAGIAFWVIKSQSSGNDEAESKESIENVGGEESGSFYDEVSASASGAEAKALEEDKASEVEANKDKADEKNVKEKETKDSQKNEEKDSPKADAKKDESKKTSTSSSSSDNEIFRSAAHMPSFPGGDAGLMSFINRNVRYPIDALDKGVQGKVMVQFVVEKNGSIGEVKVARGVDPSLDREAVRVIKSLPSFKPGLNANGEPVRVWYTIPVSFKLN